MPSAEFPHPQSDMDDGHSAIRCDACQSALDTANQTEISFLLLDHLTIPLVSCDGHLEQFTSLCGLTTTETVDLLEYQPAGGIRCPGCRNALYSSGQPVIQFQDGAIAVMACPNHQAEIVQRFQTGLQTQQQLTAGLTDSNQ